MADNTNGPGNKLGEIAASATESYVERAILRVVKHLVDSRPITAMIRDLSPETVELIYHGVPGMVGTAIGLIPDSAFRSPTAANYVRSFVNEAAKGVADAVKVKKDQGGAATADDKINAVEAAAKAVSQKKLVLAVGLVHLPNCVNLGGLKPFQKQDVSYEDAIDQQLKAAACCFKGIEAELKKQAAPPPPPAKKANPSPFDVIGGMSPEQQKQFHDWIEGLAPEQRKRAIDALHELDSAEEFTGFMAMDPQIRLEMLALLENRNARFAVRRFLGIVGGLVKSGFDRAVAALKAGWSKYLEFDRGLQPLVDEQLRRFKEPPKKRSWFHWLRMFLPV